MTAEENGQSHKNDFKSKSRTQKVPVQLSHKNVTKCNQKKGQEMTCNEIAVKQNV